MNARVRVSSLTGARQIELNSSTASLGRRRAVPSQRLMQVEGLITDVSDSSITVHDSHNQDVTATITTADTTIERGNVKLQPSPCSQRAQVTNDSSK